MPTTVPDSPGAFARDLEARLERSAAEGFVPWADAEFDAWALRLHALQATLVPAYAAWCRARGASPGAVRGWRDVPAVPTDAFKEFDLTSIPPGERTACFHSSGTTGQARSRHFHCAASLALYEASSMPWFRRHLLGGGAVPRLVNLVPVPSLAPNSSLAHMLGAAAARFLPGDAVPAGRVGADGAWDVDAGAALAALRGAAAEGRPVLVAGTAFGFVHLLDAMDAAQATVALPSGSRAMETGGYKGRSRALPKPELHAWIRSRLGIAADALVTEYGMSELGSQAYDRVAGAGGPGDGALRFPPWCRARVVDPATGADAAPGGRGVIQVLDLANAWSVAAVRTADVGVARDDGVELLGRVADAESRGCSLMASAG